MAEFSVTSYSSWPRRVAELIDKHGNAFKEDTAGEIDKWALPDAGHNPLRYDKAITEIVTELREHSIRGYRCARLTGFEIDAFRTSGLPMSDLNSLVSRIDALEQNGLVPPAIASRLRTENQAHEINRRGTWFFFFEPNILDQTMFADFFRFWGGEALFNSHDKDPETSPFLQKIGMSVVIEAIVPLRHVHNIKTLADKMAKLYHGAMSREHADHEDAIDSLLPANAIVAFHVHPSSEFSRLTGCDNWDPPLNVAE